MTEKEQKHIFEKWLYQHHALIYKVLRAYAITAVDREDLFQDITIQLWYSVPTFRQASSATTWIYRISLNTAIKWIRKESKHAPVENIDPDEFLLAEREQHIDERLTWLYEEIYKLDKIDRSIALLLLDNFSYKEMSGILGISESNVGVKINRIKKHLALQSKKKDHYGIR